jgi:methionyl-tRNA synthetase
VWFDALTNYITAAGFPDDQERFERYWPANCHIIGKDILRFHAVYWPTFLMSAGIPLPRKVFAHGWWTVEGQKMSKSLHNVVDPYQLVKEYGVDPIRYFLLREVPFGADGDFSRAAMVNRINSDLANDLGNLFSRALSMVVKYRDGVIPTPSDLQAVDRGLEEVSKKILPQLSKQLDDLAFNKALTSIWELVNAGNKYIDETAPWALAKAEKDRPRLGTVLYQALEALRIIALLIAAFMPTTAEKMWSQLGMEGNLWEQNIGENGKWGGLKPGGKVAKPSPLFPRIEA